ncbi:MAG TPA: multicopper oxidase domain-containing protein [Gemmatimonadales bacterium]|nr:multicopper oxidase domain-containing protein [Gemmatimonadales bacterium]
MGTTPFRAPLPTVEPNPNLERAGVLRDGVLTVTLEAHDSRFWTHGPNRPPATIEAFSEPGKKPQLPGPLLRVPQGTEIRLSVRNTLSAPLTLLVPASVHGGPDAMTAMDSVLVAPGAVGQLVVQATSPGNYVYRATTPANVDGVTGLAGALAGALVVDTAGAPARPNDRVFVIMATPDSDAAAHIGVTRSRLLASGGPNGFEGIAFTINGRAWPNTERIPATVGDSLHWRVINASILPHPMHLHGFYYRVDAFDAPSAYESVRPAPGQMVVTQLLPSWGAMSMTWSPTRPGNWIFHCHFALHTMPDSMTPAPTGGSMPGMVGLVLGVNVAGRAVARTPGARTADLKPARHLRLVATVDSLVRIPVMEPPGRYVPQPAMHFVLEEHGRRVDTKRAFSPELDLARGEPVSIMIVNHLPEATTVHWHGIEVEDSYMDGVAGVSGDGTRLTPEIAPGDSFEARFTPPRSGTFMYHAHVDEPREEQAGLEGALIVRDPGATRSPDDHMFFFKGGGINGEANPDTLVFPVGRPTRLRFFNLANWEVLTSFSLTTRPDSALRLVNDTLLVRWRPVAKDGFDLPANQQLPRTARQIVSMGETYDFAYTPLRKGTLRLELRGPDGKLIFRVPIRAE